MILDIHSIAKEVATNVKIWHNLDSPDASNIYQLVYDVITEAIANNGKIINPTKGW